MTKQISLAIGAHRKVTAPHPLGFNNQRSQGSIHGSDRPCDGPDVDPTRAAIEHCAGGGVGRAAGRNDVVDQRDTLALHALRARTATEGVLDIVFTLEPRQADLRRRRAHSREPVRFARQTHDAGHEARDFKRLVEATLHEACWMQRHRHEHIHLALATLGEYRAAEQGAEHAGVSERTVVLQAVNDAVEGSGI